MIARSLARSLAGSLAKGVFGDASYSRLVIVGDFPDGMNGVPYDQSIAIVGGAPPYVYVGLDAGVLPNGLSLSIVGSMLRLSGTPSSADTFNFVARVRSGDGQIADTTQSVMIAGVGTERVQNGNFSSATGWAGAGWSIAAGVATNNSPGALTNTLTTPLAGGESFQLSLDVTTNPLNSGLIVRLANSTGTPAFQTIYSGSGMAGNKTASGTVGGAYDWLVIISADDPGMVIDNASLIA